MRPNAIFVCLLIHSVIISIAFGQNSVEQSRSARDPETSKVDVRVLGHGVGRFRIGERIVHDDFESLENWVVQLQKRTGFQPARVESRSKSLDCFVPGRGCTVWFKNKLPGRVAITYDVKCPTHDPAIKGVQPRDINNFWMATDPDDRDQGLFDISRYTGAFKSYDKMHAYYASTGGRDNQTTRMRRYPREVNGRPAEHLALNDKDETPCYLISPDRVMSVQLVAFDDIIQYIVDGKLVYQVRRGDQIQTEAPENDRQTVGRGSLFDTDRFPIYREGYFGFRMVGTHHVYTDFNVYSLVPDDRMEAGNAVAAVSRPTVRVDSLQGLRDAVGKSDQQIILQPGNYTVTDRKGFRFSGSNNDVDLTGVSIELPLETVSGRRLFRLSGNHITLRGGSLEHTYPDRNGEVTDFGRYNRGKTFGGMTDIAIPGDDNRVIGLNMIVRGSFPYGYGNMYGIGGGSVVDLQKHCAIQITGDRAVIDGCNIKMEAFGHAIYVQGGDRTTVRNSVVEGTVRPSNDCYNELHDGDLAKKFDYQLQWPREVRGIPIPRDHMINCTEDGIRAYKGAGAMIVENCKVTKCRGGIKLYMAKSARITDCQVLDCVVQGFSIPSKGVIENSSGNAAYGPLLYVHSDSHHRQQIEIEVVPAPHSLGDHPLAAIKGRNHSIGFIRSGEFVSETLRPIIVGYKMRFDFLCRDYPSVPERHEQQFAKYAPKTYEARQMTIVNETDHPVVLGAMSQQVSVTSSGEVRDLGANNIVNSED